MGERCFGEKGACLHHFCLPEGKAQHIREHEQEKDEGKEYKSIGSLCGEKIRVEDVQEGAYEKPGVDAYGVVHGVPCAVPAVEFIGELGEQGEEQEYENEEFSAVGV